MFSVVVQQTCVRSQRFLKRHTGRQSDMRNRQTRKVECESARVRDDFHNARVEHVFNSGDRFGGSADLDARVMKQRFDGSVNRCGIYKRFVTLYVDDELTIEMCGDFCDSIRSRS